MGGASANPNYKDICTGKTGHAEAVKVVYNPDEVSFSDLLKVFWESHDPTQGNKQGNDRGTQYRSALFTTTQDQLALAMASKTIYEKALKSGKHSRNVITTEIGSAPQYHFAEEYHQQYLSKPGSRQYCSAQPTGIPLPDLSQWGLAQGLATTHASRLGSNVPKSRCAGGSCAL